MDAVGFLEESTPRYDWLGSIKVQLVVSATPCGRLARKARLKSCPSWREMVTLLAESFGDSRSILFSVLLSIGCEVHRGVTATRQAAGVWDLAMAQTDDWIRPIRSWVVVGGWSLGVVRVLQVVLSSSGVFVSDQWWNVDRPGVSPVGGDRYTSPDEKSVVS